MNKRIGTMLVSAAALGLVAATPAGAAPGGNTNSASYWSDKLDMTCTKSYEQAGDMYWKVDDDYGAVLVKGGSVAGFMGAAGVAGHEYVNYGEVVMAPLNKGGQQAAISWVITCDPGSYGS